MNCLQTHSPLKAIERAIEILLGAAINTFYEMRASTKKTYIKLWNTHTCILSTLRILYELKFIIYLATIKTDKKYDTKI